MDTGHGLWMTWKGYNTMLIYIISFLVPIVILLAVTPSDNRLSIMGGVIAGMIAGIMVILISTLINRRRK